MNKLKYFLFGAFFLLAFAFLFTNVNQVSAAGNCTTDTWNPPSLVPWKTTASTQTFDLTHTYKDGFLPGAPSTTETDSCTTTANHGATCQAGGVTESLQGPQDPEFGYPCNPSGLINVTSPINRIDTLLPVCGTWSGSGPTYTLSGSTDPAASGGSGQSGINVSGGSCTASSGSSCTVTISDVAGNLKSCTSPVYGNYTVAAVANSGGSVSPISQPNVAYDSTTNFTVTPSNGFTHAVGSPGFGPSGCADNTGTFTTGTNYLTGKIKNNCNYTFSFTLSVPATPTGLTATPSSCGTGRIDVSWNASSGATSYTLKDGAVTIYTGAATSFAHTGLVAGSSHSYTVSATNSGGTSAYSSAVSASAPIACAAVVNGSCSVTHYGCTAGTSANNVDGATSWTWVCNGSNGGTNASCSEAKPLPDLTASSPTPTTATTGVAQTFSSTISNIGTASTGASFSNFFQVATAAGGGGTVTDLASTTMTTLAAGATGTSTKAYTFPSAGTYSVRACADKTNAASTGVITESNEGNNCSSWTNVSVTSTPVMSGTLTPNPTSCVIASGASSCSVTLNWSIANPEGIPTAITATGMTNVNVTNTLATPQSGNQSLTVPYSSRIFYLYNNGVQLATSSATASCTGGTAWNGSICAPAMSGTLTSSAPSCVIASGASTCIVNLTWTTTNPEATSAVTSSYPAPNTTVFTGLNGGPSSVTIPYSSRTFYLYNNAKSLVPTSPSGAGIVVTASCTGGTAWNGTVCANVPPTVNAGPDKAITLPTSSSAPTGAYATDVSPGTISSRLWTKTSGPSATITNGTTLTPTFSNMTAAGTYVFRLTATDNQGATGFDEMQVVVSASGGGEECTNGATNYPECTIDGGGCLNGATNPPLCTIGAGTNGNCAITPNTCSSGTPTVGAWNASNHVWTCTGTNGVPVSCSAPKRQPDFIEN